MKPRLPLTKIGVCIVLVGLGAQRSCARAQQQTTAIQRISGSLAQCVASAEQQVDTIAELQKQIAAKDARIKELEAKTEPKKE